MRPQGAQRGYEGNREQRGKGEREKRERERLEEGAKTLRSLEG